MHLFKLLFRVVNHSQWRTRPAYWANSKFSRAIMRQLTISKPLLKQEVSTTRTEIFATGGPIHRVIISLSDQNA